MNTKPNSKSKLIAKIIALILALSLTACSIAPASAPSPSAPPATEAILTPTEIPLEFNSEVFSTTDSLPEEFIPFMDLFTEMAEEDGLEIDKLGPILWLKAAQGKMSVNYALLQIAVVTDIKDPDGKTSNPKPVYYMVYENEQGQMQTSYVLGKLIEQDPQGVSYVTRMLDENTFRNWQNNTQPEDGSYKVGQIVYAIPLREDINVEEARIMQNNHNSGDLNSTDLIQNYTVGWMFIQPGKEDQSVALGIPSAGSPLESILGDLLAIGASPAKTAGLEELSATATAPEPTPEPTEIALTPEQQLTEYLKTSEAKESIDQFVNAMKMAGIEVTEEEVNQNLVIQELKDINNNPFLVATYNLDPDLTQTGETLEGPVPLIIAEKNENGELGWSDSLGKLIEYKNKTLRLAGNIRMLPQYKNVMNKLNGYSMPDGHWKDPNSSTPLRPSRDQYNFSYYDTQINLLAREGIGIQFYHLIWGLEYALPDWLINGSFDPEELKQIANDHIETVMTHYKGKVQKYVVVNEPWGNPWDNNSKFWFNRLGDPSSWIPELFKTANRIDLGATLILNDFGIEIPGTRLWNSQKETQYFNIIKQLHDSGLPVEAGLQLHLYSADFSNPGRFNQLIDNYRSQLRKYRQEGIVVNITEFDLFPDGVDKSNLPQLDSKITEAIIRVSLKEGVSDFTFFGTPGSEEKGPLFDQSRHLRPAYYAAIKEILISLLNESP